MLSNPEFIQTNEQLTVIHLTVPCAEIGDVMGSAITEILSTLPLPGLSFAHGLKPKDSVRKKVQNTEAGLAITHNPLFLAPIPVHLHQP